MKCCSKLTDEIKQRRFSLTDKSLYINFKDCNYDQVYGHASFTV